MATKAKKIEMLTLTGQVLFGERWQTDLAKGLNLSDARRIRQWLSSDRPIPDGIIQQLSDLLKERSVSINAALFTLNKCL